MSQYQPGMSARDMMMQLAYNRASKDGTEEKLGAVLAVTTAADSAATIQDTMARNALTLTSTLSELTKQGYDAESDVARNQVAANQQINLVLIGLAKAAEGHAARI